MIGFVIGNGESRIGFDLNKLVGVGPIYGCNALYRDFYPDTLISVDDRMITEIRETSVPKSIEFIYRQKTDNGNVLMSSNGDNLHDNGYSAGQTALDVMCRRYPLMSEIYLVGFDLFSKTGTVNNVYKDTNCYKKSDGKATYTGNWVERLRYIFSTHPYIKFYRVCDDEMNNEYKVSKWSDLSNIYYINYDQLNVLLDVERRSQ
jgi:hypothetical protein